METSLFDYLLPPGVIAQQPAEPRDSSRLLVLDRASGRVVHRHFRDLGSFLRPGDLLVGNDSRVIPARLRGRKATGGEVELFLLRARGGEGRVWECLVRGRGLGVGVRVAVGALAATVVAVGSTGVRLVEFSEPVHPSAQELGEVPLPPYITAYTGDRERYQTVYSRAEGSVAAPTAGLHFTPALLGALREEGVAFDTVTLHVGLDTFKPIESERVEAHPIHSEWAELSVETARRVNETTLAQGRVVAVGTTTVRTLEWGATGAQGLDPAGSESCPWQRVAAFGGEVNLFIYPGYRFRAVDALITNFHLPRSSLLLLVSAFIAQKHREDLDAGRRILLDTYAQAIEAGYRFFSFGDAMLIV